MSDDNLRNEGVGFLGFLSLIFIALKLMGEIEWSWLWVLCPLWIPIMVVTAIVGAFASFALFITALAMIKKGK